MRSRGVGSILIISPEPWDGHFVSKHHYAVTMAKQGHKVYFLDPPDDSKTEAKITKTECGNLWAISASIVTKGLRFYPKVVRNFLEKHWLEKLEKEIGQKFTTIWLFENSRFFNMGFAGKRLKVYHQVDLNQDFHLKEAVKSADICFCNTDFICQKLMLYNHRVHKIHHGVAIPSAIVTLPDAQLARFTNNAVNAVYVGNLDIPYLDVRLLADLVQWFPTVRFHFVGSYSCEGALFARCGAHENVTWWGQVPSRQISGILAHCDIQLLTYKVESDWEKAQMASPHKMMEYFSSGKVTVATYSDEYKDKRHLLEMVDDSKEYLQKFEEVISNLDYYNSQEKQQARISFATDHTYEKQLGKIVKYLKEYNFTL